MSRNYNDEAAYAAGTTLKNYSDVLVLLDAITRGVGSLENHPPCALDEVTPPQKGFYVRTPHGYAVQFTVMGVPIVAFQEQLHAQEVRNLLKAKKIYRVSNPNEGELFPWVTFHGDRS